mmetsp:Transcript_74130/g.197659  ORF Transcript_74130/g.197659 Transcript_74130/m.197659 type:complete len:249 (-) Transcript_74130:1069-1815(-)
MRHGPQPAEPRHRQPRLRLCPVGPQGLQGQPAADRDVAQARRARPLPVQPLRGLHGGADPRLHGRPARRQRVAHLRAERPVQVRHGPPQGRCQRWRGDELGCPELWRVGHQRAAAGHRIVAVVQGGGLARGGLLGALPPVGPPHCHGAGGHRFVAGPLRARLVHGHEERPLGHNPQPRPHRRLAAAFRGPLVHRRRRHEHLLRVCCQGHALDRLRRHQVLPPPHTRVVLVFAKLSLSTHNWRLHTRHR